MAEGTDETKSVCLSEPVQSRQTDRIGKDSLEGHSQESGCFLFSDLQPAACVLHSTELGCSRCGRAARYASQQPRDETLLSAGVGSPGSRAPRTREPTPADKSVSSL